MFDHISEMTQNYHRQPNVSPIPQTTEGEVGLQWPLTTANEIKDQVVRDQTIRLEIN